jgi:hypothetical protein
VKPLRTNHVFRAALLALALLAPVAHAERVKDLASVAGVRGNQLVGYGLVVGLDGTGDQTSQAPFTIQSIKNMLTQFGVTVPPNVNPPLKNVAAVVVRSRGAALARTAHGPGQLRDLAGRRQVPVQPPERELDDADAGVAHVPRRASTHSRSRARARTRTDLTPSSPSCRRRAISPRARASW